MFIIACFTLYRPLPFLICCIMSFILYILNILSVSKSELVSLIAIEMNRCANYKKNNRQLQTLLRHKK